jgi:hypothetical protein
VFGAQTPTRPVQFETFQRPSFYRRDTIRSNYIIATFHSKSKKRIMSDHGKRSVQVNVRLSEEDFALIKKAAAKRWPSAVLSNSGILLGLAKLAANETLAGAKKQRRN